MFIPNAEVILYLVLKTIFKFSNFKVLLYLLIKLIQHQPEQQIKQISHSDKTF